MKLLWLLPALLGSILLSSSAQAANLQYWRFDRTQNRLELATDEGIQPRAQIVSNPTRLVIDLPGVKLGGPKQAMPVDGIVNNMRVAQFDPQTTRIVMELAPGYTIDPRQVRFQYASARQWTVEMPRPQFSPQLASAAPPTQTIAVPTAPGVAVVPTLPSTPTVPPIPNASVPPGSIVVVTEPLPQPPTRPPTGTTSPLPRPTTPLPTPSPPSSPTPTPSLPQVPNGRFLVVIDPGHGGPDPGAVGIGGLRETDVVLAISKQVATLLERQGVRVILTRQDERNLELKPRVDIANRANATAFVSIHANAFGANRPDVNGVETYYYSSGLNLAKSIQQSILETNDMRDRGVKQANFYVMRYSSMPAVLVEVGFVTGRDDARRLADPNGRNQIAAAIAQGILRYLQR
ncbi:N-acetylmuramoyl-L-alanine amidase [Pantanalinema rosaneae CENA516]|uniref:N-acetylmuramoyl-L-alanine amidase n=1 Tax=Pantanalinema rosaneae TaxID=1620701 RepID=UPI003D6F9688